MKQSLQLKIGQHLTMTPQLQQAIRLLQLSTVELQTEVQEALETNPMLDQDDGSGSETPEPAQSTDEVTQEASTQPEGENQTIPEDLPVDSNWEDVFDTGATSYSAPDMSNSRDIMETVTVSGNGLHDHLAWQIELTNFSDTDRLIALTIIDSIDDDGYLQMSTDELQKLLDGDPVIEADEIEAVIHRIQQLDPIGVCARNLQESLQLQLQQYDNDTPWLSEARTLIRDYFTLLSNRDYTRLARKMKLATADLQQVIQLVQGLNPRPGAQFSTSETEYIVPDVFVVRKKRQVGGGTQQ